MKCHLQLQRLSHHADVAPSAAIGAVKESLKGLLSAGLGYYIYNRLRALSVRLRLLYLLGPKCRSSGHCGKPREWSRISCRAFGHLGHHSSPLAAACTSPGLLNSRSFRIWVVMPFLSSVVMRLLSVVSFAHTTITRLFYRKAPYPAGSCFESMPPLCSRLPRPTSHDRGFFMPCRRHSWILPV